MTLCLRAFVVEKIFVASLVIRGVLQQLHLSVFKNVRRRKSCLALKSITSYNFLFSLLSLPSRCNRRRQTRSTIPTDQCYPSSARAFGWRKVISWYFTSMRVESRCTSGTLSRRNGIHSRQLPACLQKKTTS